MAHERNTFAAAHRTKRLTASTASRAENPMPEPIAP